MVGKAVCVSRSVRSSDCFAILRNLLKTHIDFTARRPADAKVGHLGRLLNINSLAFSLEQKLIDGPVKPLDFSF